MLTKRKRSSSTLENQQNNNNNNNNNNNEEQTNASSSKAFTFPDPPKSKRPRSKKSAANQQRYNENRTALHKATVENDKAQRCCVCERSKAADNKLGKEARLMAAGLKRPKGIEEFATEAAQNPEAELICGPCYSKYVQDQAKHYKTTSQLKVAHYELETIEHSGYQTVGESGAMGKALVPALNAPGMPTVNIKIGTFGTSRSFLDKINATLANDYHVVMFTSHGRSTKPKNKSKVGEIQIANHPTKQFKAVTTILQKLAELQTEQSLLQLVHFNCCYLTLDEADYPSTFVASGFTGDLWTPSAFGNSIMLIGLVDYCYGWKLNDLAKSLSEMPTYKEAGFEVWHKK